MQHPHTQIPGTVKLRESSDRAGGLPIRITFAHQSGRAVHFTINTVTKSLIHFWLLVRVAASTPDAATTPTPKPEPLNRSL